jgi:endonuclease G
MAPEARIVAVVPYMKTSPGSPPSLGYSNSHQDALAFLLAFQKNRGLPMAVNVSLGMNAGAHDGSSDLEKVFDAISQNGKAEGFVVVKSAGNERGHRGHTQIQAAVGAVMQVQWVSTKTPRDSDYLEFWYHSDDELKFTLIDPAGKRSPVITHANRSGTYDATGNDVHLSLSLHVPDNDDNRLVIQVIPVAAPIQVGVWTLEVEGIALGPANGKVDGWVERNDDRPVLFTVGSNDDTTLSIPGTAGTVVCVAASNSATPLRLTNRSSYGPTRKNGPKPDVNAPGDRITAVCSNSVDHQAVVTMTGTSMAAPHVTGALALVLSARHKKVQAGATKTQFNATNLAGMLRRSSDYFNKLHNKGTGYGALNALRLFKEADLA